MKYQSLKMLQTWVFFYKLSFFQYVSIVSMSSKAFLKNRKGFFYVQKRRRFHHTFSEFILATLKREFFLKSRKLLPWALYTCDINRYIFFFFWFCTCCSLYKQIYFCQLQLLIRVFWSCQSVICFQFIFCISIYNINCLLLFLCKYCLSEFLVFER